MPAAATPVPQPGSRPAFRLTRISTHLKGKREGVVNRWYRNAVVYSVDVGLFQDSNLDGVGDLPGLVSRLDYLSRLGVTTLWLGPLQPVATS